MSSNQQKIGNDSRNKEKTDNEAKELDVKDSVKIGTANVMETTESQNNILPLEKECSRLKDQLSQLERGTSDFNIARIVSPLQRMTKRVEDLENVFSKLKESITVLGQEVTVPESIDTPEKHLPRFSAEVTSSNPYR